MISDFQSEEAGALPAWGSIPEGVKFLHAPGFLSHLLKGIIMETILIAIAIIVGAWFIISLIGIAAWVFVVKKMFKGGTYTPRSDRPRF